MIVTADLGAKNSDLIDTSGIISIMGILLEAHESIL